MGRSSSAAGVLLLLLALWRMALLRESREKAAGLSLLRNMTISRRPTDARRQRSA